MGAGKYGVRIYAGLWHGTDVSTTHLLGFPTQRGLRATRVFLALAVDGTGPDVTLCKRIARNGARHHCIVVCRRRGDSVRRTGVRGTVNHSRGIRGTVCGQRLASVTRSLLARRHSSARSAVPIIQHTVVLSHHAIVSRRAPVIGVEEDCGGGAE